MFTVLDVRKKKVENLGLLVIFCDFLLIVKKCLAEKSKTNNNVILTRGNSSASQRAGGDNNHVTVYTVFKTFLH